MDIVSQPTVSLLSILSGGGAPPREGVGGGGGLKPDLHTHTGITGSYVSAFCVRCGETEVVLTGRSLRCLACPVAEAA